MPQTDPLMSDPTIRRLWAEIVALDREVQAKRIKADPEGYRNTRQFDPGARLSYRYFSGGKNGRGTKVRFCYSVERNAAGYFLLWRELVGKRVTKRDQWQHTKSKADAIETCRRLASALPAPVQA